MMKHLSAALIPALLFPAIAQAQSVFDLDEIVFSVNAAEIEQNRVGNSVTVITEENLEKAGDLQLTEYLTRLPGVSLTQNGPQGGTADIRIRGAQGRYISVYIDGILVTDPSGTVIAYDDFGGLTTGSIRRIEVLRGSQSALYGGSAVGGVINISTVAGLDATEGTNQTAALEIGSYNTVALSYGLTQRTGPLTLSLGLDSTRSDGFSAADENAGNTEADGFNRSRLSFGAAYAVNNSLTVGLNGFIEAGKAEFDEFHDDPVDGSVGDEFSERRAHAIRAYANWTHLGWEHKLALSYFQIDRRNASLTLGPSAPFYLSPYDNSFTGRRTSLEYLASDSISPTLNLTFGLNAMRETAASSRLPAGREIVDTYAGFIETVWSPVEQLDLTTTLRRDNHSSFGGYTTGRVGVAWRASDALLFRGAAGTGFRAPSIDELYGDYLTDLFFVGNPNLLPEESLALEVGFDYGFRNGALLRATAFSINIDNLVTYCGSWSLPSSGCPVIGAADPDTLFNVPGTSTRRGVELSGSLPISETTTLTGAYTYTNAKTASGATLALTPTRDIALGIDTEWQNGWSGNLTAHHVSGLIDGRTPLADYTLANATIRREITEGVEAYLRIHNLFDQQYQTRRGYGTSDRAFYLGLRSRF
jgi:vitamin B12 transporter